MGNINCKNNCKFLRDSIEGVDRNAEMENPFSKIHPEISSKENSNNLTDKEDGKFFKSRTKEGSTPQSDKNTKTFQKNQVIEEIQEEDKNEEINNNNGVTDNLKDSHFYLFNENKTNNKEINDQNNFRSAEELSDQIENSNKITYEPNIIHQNNNTTIKKDDIEDIIDKNLFPEDEFSRYLFEHINLLRENPKKFIPIIEENKSKIISNKSGKLIFKNKVKVALETGIKAFDEAIDDLNNTEPSSKLIYFPLINIPLPETEEEMQKREYLKEKASQLKYYVKSFWKDNIKDPETSFLLMVIDDTGNKGGLKRKSLLDPKLKYIGICSKSFGKSFCCYLSFTDKL
jgi:hypothetical protein